MSTNRKLKKSWYVKRVEYHTTVNMNKVELYVFMQQILSYIKGGKSK